jgi:prephenate dehydrogenase
VALRAETIQAGLAQGLIDRGTTDLASGVHDADVVVMATPVRVILRLLDEIGPLVPQGCLLIDLGSTKAQIIAQLEQLPHHVQPLGGHPMCGKEISGITAADASLYHGCTFILTPLPRTSEASLALGFRLAEAVGAHPLVLEADRQDFLVATMSHLPYLLACALVSTADILTSPDPAAWEIVAGGFRDTSRVAGSDVTMMMDILLTNREQILKALETYSTQLHTLAQLLKEGDEEELNDVLSNIRKTRKKMFP